MPTTIGFKLVDVVGKADEDMDSEQIRLESFEKWPKCDIVTPLQLARAGFCYIGPKDRVQCFMCKLILYNWKANENPEVKHRQQAAGCPFLPTIADLDRLPSLLNPENVAMKSEQTRYASFTDWPRQLRQRPEELSRAGFYYAGTGDRVCCFSCGQSLYNWRPEDDMWMNHVQASPECAYLQHLRGYHFVQQLQRTFSESSRKQRPEKDNMSTTTRRNGTSYQHEADGHSAASEENLVLAHSNLKGESHNSLPGECNQKSSAGVDAHSKIAHLNVRLSEMTLLEEISQDPESNFNSSENLLCVGTQRRLEKIEATTFMDLSDSQALIPLNRMSRVNVKEEEVSWDAEDEIPLGQKVQSCTIDLCSSVDEMLNEFLDATYNDLSQLRVNAMSKQQYISCLIQHGDACEYHLHKVIAKLRRGRSAADVLDGTRKSLQDVKRDIEDQLRPRCVAPYRFTKREVMRSLFSSLHEVIEDIESLMTVEEEERSDMLKGFEQFAENLRKYTDWLEGCLASDEA